MLFGIYSPSQKSPIPADRFDEPVTINTHYGAHFINLMVNDAIVGGTLTDTQEAGDYDSDSNTAVVVLSQGDSVSLRTTSASDRAQIYADVHAVTSFAGWRL